jgi:hypothetical protein
MLKENNIKFYIYGGYVRDDIAFLGIGKEVHNKENLKDFLCNKFSKTLKFDIDVAVKVCDKVHFNEIIEQIQSVLKSDNKKFVLKPLASQRYYFETRTIEINIDNYIYGIDITPSFSFVLNGISNRIDFDVNSLAYDNNDRLILRPGTYTTNCVKTKILEIISNIYSCRAYPSEFFGNAINMVNFDSKILLNNIYMHSIYIDNIKTLFVPVFNRLEKMKLYGFTIVDDSNYAKCLKSNIKCCESPKLLLPKITGSNTKYLLCINCVKINTNTPTFSMKFCDICIM